MKTDNHFKTGKIPEFLKGCLWSYDIDKLNIDLDFTRIATNILIYGDLKAVCWLLDNFSNERIVSTLIHPLKGEWDPRSLNFWAGYFQVEPNKKKALKTLAIA
jgi:hypothetical protein